MGSGRTPCCSKTGLKKGPWSPGEDHRLISFIRKHGHSNWRALPKQAGLLRCGKSCRLRWINYLHPDIKRGNFTQDEEETIIKLHESLGNKWSKIASQLPGRTDNEIKNMWNTHLKKRLQPKTPNPCGDEPEKSSVTSSSSSTNSHILYHDEDIGMGNGDQAHSMFMSENPVLEYSRMILEDNEETLMDPLFDWDFLFDDKIDDGGSKNISGIEETNPLVDDLKEISNSSNSTCGSYVTHSKQVHETIPKEQTHPQITYEVLGEAQDTIQEINKQDHNGEILEIPFDPNINHFDMFEAALMSEIKGQKHNVSEEEESKRKIESRRWVTYLENELGLQPMNDEEKEILTRDTSSSGNATVLEAEIDPVAMYFRMWPHSPHNF